MDFASQPDSSIKKIAATLTKMGFTKCMADQCLFFRKSSDGTVAIVVYIDDTLCVGDERAINKFKQEIKKYFVTKEEGEMTEYVGCEVVRKNRDELITKQSHLIGRIRNHFDKFTSALKKREIPLTTGFTVQRSDEKGELITAESQHLYRAGIGMLLYLVKFSRPDIPNTVRELSKANTGAADAQFKAMLRVINYTLDTENVGLSYKIKRKELDSVWKKRAFCDSDFAGDKETSISVTGYCIYLMGCLIAWKSRAQKHVTLSSSEVEFVAVSDVCTEILFIKMILESLGIKAKTPITVHCDNVRAIFLSYNAKISQRTKHIDTKCRTGSRENCVR